VSLGSGCLDGRKCGPARAGTGVSYDRMVRPKVSSPAEVDAFTGEAERVDAAEDPPA